MQGQTTGSASRCLRCSGGLPRSAMGRRHSAALH
jgi:hypothetical protein